MTSRLGTKRRARVAAAATAALLAYWLYLPGAGTAAACGCFSPPIPTANEIDFAVNQQAEQIAFEVLPGNRICAHVMIRYSGNPKAFGWLVPVPSLPQLALSRAGLFTVLETLTAPTLTVQERSLCPDPEYRCEQHPFPLCYSGGSRSGCSGVGCRKDTRASFSGNNNANSRFDGGTWQDGGVNGPDVTIHGRQQIGNYDTVILSGGSAQAVLDWLNTHGFIVNQTMTPYMQPYVDAGMLFVASRLVPGSGLDQIKPLLMCYDGTQPMIPLMLTAVGAEPHLTVQTYIFGNTTFVPDRRPVIVPNAGALGRDRQGRLNYPALLSRSIDEAGGDAFVREYAGRVPSRLGINAQTACCGSPSDSCNLGNDGACQCPGDTFDAADCGDEIHYGALLLESLSATHMYVTRLTTRLSPEEMTFDPMFAAEVPARNQTLNLTGEVASLEGCRGDVVDAGHFERVWRRQDCATLYCGPDARCAIADGRAGCACPLGEVARAYVDLDGARSITCVPEQATVDLAAGGLVLPNVCGGVSCGGGTCVERAGVPTCRCDPFHAAVLDATGLPTCAAIDELTADSGGGDYTGELEEVAVCAPPPPECGPYGWLVPNSWAVNHGAICPDSLPDPERLVPPPKPTCPEDQRQFAAGVPLMPFVLGLLFLVGLLLVRRRGRPNNAAT